MSPMRLPLLTDYPSDVPAVLNAIVEAADRFGVESVGKGWAGGKQLAKIHGKPLTTQDFQDLTRELRERQLSGWLNGLFLCAVCSPEIAVSTVLDQVGDFRCAFSGCHSTLNPQRRQLSNKLAELLYVDGGLQLFAELVIGVGRDVFTVFPTDQAAAALSKGLASVPLDHPAAGSYVRALMCLPPSEAEVGLWWTERMAPLRETWLWN